MKSVIVSSSPGSGKTNYTIKEILQNYLIDENFILLIIIPRVLMIQELISKINKINNETTNLNLIYSYFYEKISKKKDSRVFISTYESLVKLEIPINKQIVLMFDEFQLLIQEIITSPLLDKNRLFSCYQILLKFLYRSSISYFIDPYFHDLTKIFIETICPNTDYIYLNNRSLDLEYINFYNDYDLFLEKFLFCINNKKNIHVYSDSAEFIKLLYDVYRLDDSILYTKSLKMFNNEIKKITLDDLHYVKNLFCSPIINSCISIENSPIEDVFCFKISNHICYYEIYNSLHRCRGIKRINIIDLKPEKKKNLIKPTNTNNEYDNFIKLYNIFYNISFDDIKNINIIGEKNIDYNDFYKKLGLVEKVNKIFNFLSNQNLDQVDRKAYNVLLKIINYKIIKRKNIYILQKITRK